MLVAAEGIVVDGQPIAGAQVGDFAPLSRPFTGDDEYWMICGGAQ